ncbi:hypothetical protein F443_16196 [Phytophthora nicotianae P1569]|uniref:RxLR effector protein n=1 Tax=Phytophthora nicotianae P1569 TaxID=1317065 RepID=V9EG75_PHYNI|nr:hypothetical protein F443_16196 [Phytophthora nicotianae P1569]
MTTNRLLRASDEAQKDDEERGIVLTGFLNRIESGTDKIEQHLKHISWLAQGRSAGGAFKSYKLDKTNALFTSDDIVKWSKYVRAKVGKENEGKTMIDTLLDHYDNFALAQMIESAKISTNLDIKRLAPKLQEAQFTKWKQHHVEPGKIKQRLEALDSSGWWSTLNKGLVEEYTRFWMRPAQKK